MTRRAESRARAGTEFLCFFIAYSLAAAVLTYILFLE